MSDVFREFCDENMHRAYPLTDAASGMDETDSFTIPTSLITDIYLCAPDLPLVDRTKFYIQNILIRRFFIDITIGYAGTTPQPIGVFKNISVSGSLQSCYNFVPFKTQTGDEFAPLYFMTGQIVIGDCAEALRSLGSWNFPPANTYIIPSRVSKGLLNVQYVSVNDRLFTGHIRFKEGTNISLDTTTEERDGETITVITVSATLNAGATLQLQNDEDLINWLVSEYGTPILTINGLLPNSDRNFDILGADCTSIESLANGIALGNPCASPCCDENANLTNIMESIANLNLRYARLKDFFESTAETVNSLQNKLLILGSTL